MKILHVITSMNPKRGGVCQVLRNLNPYLIEKGIDVEIVSLDNNEDDFGIQDDFIIHRIGSGKTSYQYQPKLVKWLNDNILSFDYVIGHGLWQYPNYALNKVIKSLKKQNNKVPKVIVMPHGMLDPYFQKSPERKWKALRNEIVWSLIEKKCINQADIIFFTCNEEMRLAATTFTD
ncbi:glycosyltransferase, partial [Flavobacterium sp. LBUM151]